MEEIRRAKLTMTETLIAITISLTCVTMCAVFLVDEIPAIVERGVPDNFMGLILVPLVEKAAEHITTIDEAWYRLPVLVQYLMPHCRLAH